MPAKFGWNTILVGTHLPPPLSSTPVCNLFYDFASMLPNSILYIWSGLNSQPRIYSLCGVGACTAFCDIQTCFLIQHLQSLSHLSQSKWQILLVWRMCDEYENQFCADLCENNWNKFHSYDDTKVVLQWERYEIVLGLGILKENG